MSANVTWYAQVSNADEQLNSFIVVEAMTAHKRHDRCGA
jgi:hypothetical protein